MRPPDLVDRAIEILVADKKADSARGVVPSGQNPHKMWRINSLGKLDPLLKVKGVDEPYNAARQNLPNTFWQTGHIDVIRTSTILKKRSMSGEEILPVLIDPRYTVDIDTQTDWRRAEWLAASGDLDLVRPGKPRRSIPKDVRLLVMDFDGVLTDNRVWVNQDGMEEVAANRSDGLGIKMLLNAGIQAAVISLEQNSVVARRCEKLGIPYQTGIEDKPQALKKLMVEKNVNSNQVVYIGNDTNDLPCFSLVACAVAVADSHSEVLNQADIRLSKIGGHGAVRELIDMLLANHRGD
jgi:N-acylneuraminate cytidylyltransferase